MKTFPAKNNYVYSFGLEKLQKINTFAMNKLCKRVLHSYIFLNKLQIHSIKILINVPLKKIDFN